MIRMITSELNARSDEYLDNGFAKLLAKSRSLVLQLKMVQLKHGRSAAAARVFVSWPGC